MRTSKWISVCIIFICSAGDFLHEAGAYNEQEFSGSEDGRDPYDDDQDNERIESTSILYNYQTLMEKRPRRGKWSKQDTEVFYEVFV